MTDVVWVISSSVLIAVVLLLRAIFGKKMRAGLRYALWGLVLLRLLIPGTVFSSPVSVKSAVISNETMENLDTIKGYSEVRIDEKYGTVWGWSAANAAEANNVETGTKKADVIMENVTPERSERIEKTVEVRNVLNIVWYTGMGLMAVYLIYVNVRLYLKLRDRRVRLGVTAPCHVDSVEGLESSCLFLNTIYVSKETADDPERLRLVLAHELAHLRHGDAVFTFLRCAALALHWYNPLVWIAAFASRQDSELFADAGAIKALGEDNRESYGRTLIELSARPSVRASVACVATTMANNKRALKERVTNVADRRKKAAIVTAVVLAAALLTVGCVFLGSAKAEGGEQKELMPVEAEATPPVHMTPDPTKVPTHMTPDPTPNAPVDTPAPTASATPDTTEEPAYPDDIYDVIKTFLKDSAQYQFFHEPVDLTRFTIESIPEESRDELEDALWNYTAVRSRGREWIEPYVYIEEDPALDGGSMDALLSNLLLHRQEQIYYEGINEIDGTVYTRFNISFNYGYYWGENGVAVIAVSEGMSWVYEGVDFSSGMGTDYLITLVRFNDQWRIASVESDSEFYEMYHLTGCDVDYLLRGIRDAHELNN